MKHTIRALLGAGALALVLTPAAAGAKSGKTVTVRVEGVSKTLLATTTVKVPASGWITKGHTPKKACSATTAAGALDVATRHRWTGSWDQKYEALLLTTIFGVKYTLASKDYWSVWVDGRYGQSGLCGLKLHQGEQLLFAAVEQRPTFFSGSPLILKASATQVRVGSTLTVTAGYKGKHGFTPASGVQVSAGGVTETTDGHGETTFPISKAGTLVVRGSGANYIRAAPLKVTELP